MIVKLLGYTNILWDKVTQFIKEENDENLNFNGLTFTPAGCWIKFLETYNQTVNLSGFQVTLGMKLDTPEVWALSATGINPSRVKTALGGCLYIFTQDIERWIVAVKLLCNKESSLNERELGSRIYGALEPIGRELFKGYQLKKDPRGWLVEV